MRAVLRQNGIEAELRRLGCTGIRLAKVTGAAAVLRWGAETIRCGPGTVHAALFGMEPGPEGEVWRCLQRIAR